MTRFRWKIRFDVAVRDVYKQGRKGWSRSTTCAAAIALSRCQNAPRFQLRDFAFHATFREDWVVTLRIVRSLYYPWLTSFRSRIGDRTYAFSPFTLAVTAQRLQWKITFPKSFESELLWNCYWRWTIELCVRHLTRQVSADEANLVVHVLRIEQLTGKNSSWILLWFYKQVYSVIILMGFVKTV